MRLHVHEAEVVGGSGRVVAVCGGVVAGKEQLRAGRAVLERRRRVGGRRGRLHRLCETGEVELIRVTLAVNLCSTDRIQRHWNYTTRNCKIILVTCRKVKVVICVLDRGLYYCCNKPELIHL